jgi:FkbM family methyltransferase
MFDHIVVRRWNDFTTNNPKPKILDCGANIGISVLHYKRLFPEARIIAFEPDPEICQVLRRNLRVNNAEDVQVVETALWDTDGEMSFDPDGADGGRLGGNGKGGVSYRVKTERLVRYLNEPVDLLKLDIEGAEGHVIRDCGSYLRNVDNIVLEYHVIANKEQDLGNLLLMLTANGFRYYINSFGSWLSLTTDLSEIGSSIEQLLMISARSRWDHT